MKSVLREIVEHKRGEVSARQTARPLSTFEKSVEKADNRFLSAFQRRDCANIIAEVKPRSPSMGSASSSFDLASVIATYNKYARAISVLTDEKYFGGSLQLLSAVKQHTSLPVLCKDFIISKYQVYEARAAQADAILLIVKSLEDKELSDLYAHCSELGMTAVVEVQNEQEIERALKIDPQLILVNNRNLDSLEIDLATSKKLMPSIPDSIVKVAASGIETASDIQALALVSNNFLIGSSLMKSDNIEAKLKELANALSTPSSSPSAGDARR
ncbi:MAG TPA: indole-3-glycerol phosphate synthase TrpC [Candidatus Melainabacteria bacterium]|jgi:indole-3-glycerol phosphate synthase|nr:indole-3-glycerol phosphate synthase TrpC [Candidatus Melainabacteria bacterium]